MPRGLRRHPREVAGLAAARPPRPDTCPPGPDICLSCVRHGPIPIPDPDPDPDPDSRSRSRSPIPIPDPGAHEASRSGDAPVFNTRARPRKTRAGSNTAAGTSLRRHGCCAGRARSRDENRCAALARRGASGGGTTRRPRRSQPARPPRQPHGHHQPNRRHQPWPTNRGHQPRPPTAATNRGHQPRPPTAATNRGHQPRPPTAATKPWHVDFVQKSFDRIAGAGGSGLAHRGLIVDEECPVRAWAEIANAALDLASCGEIVAERADERAEKPRAMGGG